MSAHLAATQGATNGAERRRRGPPNSTWTDARLDLLRAEYAAADSVGALAEALSALPGPRITAQMVYDQACELALNRTNRRRPPPPTPPKAWSPPEDEALEPVEIDAAAILAWAQANGVADPRPRLGDVNARRRALGLPPFLIARRRVG